LTGETLATIFSRPARPNAAVCSPEDGQELSFEELESAVLAVAGRLRSIGVQRGDRVALVLGNGPEFVVVLLAIALLGAAAAPLNPAYTRDEYSFYLRDLDPRVLLVSAGDSDAARAAAAAKAPIVEVLALDRQPPELSGRGRAIEREQGFEQGEGDDIALLLHTSGTTSRPKQVPLLQRNLMSSARTIADHYRLDERDVSYVAMPLFHVHGLVASCLAAFAAGGSVVIPRRLTARAFWSQTRQHGVTWFSAGPTLHKMLLDKRGAHRPPTTLRFVRSCSSAMPLDLMQEIEQVFGVPLLEAYGMTEASHQMASNPLPPARRIPGSVGIPTGTEIRVVDSGGTAVADGTSGEVVIRGPGVTPGYLNNPTANADAFRDGWFRTGDRGVLERGYLRLEGRIKEMILRGGENISPHEIEEVLLSHPRVTDAVCFGIEDRLYGEQVAAAVVVSGAIDERALRDHCRERLASFKVPHEIKLVASIPRTPTGKLQRKRIAALLEMTPQ
jgi:acyl-CoA synthetase (AMP-forming)/AMP-acid ligase II